MNSLVHFIEPLQRRLGSLVAGGLVGYGIEAQSSNAIGVGIAAGFAVLADLLLAKWSTRADAKGGK